MNANLPPEVSNATILKINSHADLIKYGAAPKKDD